MKRISLAIGLVGLLIGGCAGVLDPITAEAARIAPTQALRPTFDSSSGTWLPSWVDPENFLLFDQQGGEQL